MDELRRREEKELRNMILGLDVEGIEKRIRSYRFGKRVCLILFFLVLIFFNVQEWGEGHPVMFLALFVALYVSGFFWFTERSLIKTRKIMLETLDKLAEEQIKSAASAPNDAPLA